MSAKCWDDAPKQWSQIAHLEVRENNFQVPEGKRERERETRQGIRKGTSNYVALRWNGFTRIFRNGSTVKLIPRPTSGWTWSKTCARHSANERVFGPVRSHVRVPRAFGRRARPRAVVEAHRRTGLQRQRQHVTGQTRDFQLVAWSIPELERYDAAVGRLARVLASGFACNHTKIVGRIVARRAT